MEQYGHHQECTGSNQVQDHVAYVTVAMTFKKHSLLSQAMNILSAD